MCQEERIVMSLDEDPLGLGNIQTERVYKSWFKYAGCAS